MPADTTVRALIVLTGTAVDVKIKPSRAPRALAKRSPRLLAMIVEPSRPTAILYVPTSI